MWRPSGGRGEYEFVPSTSLVGRRVTIRIPELSVQIDSEVTGTISQGKPRLRKDEPNNRQKLHLVPLVMAAARLPDPAREDKLGKVSWPLENKAFIVSEMDFSIAHDDGTTTILEPLAVHILHSSQVIDLKMRFAAIAADVAALPSILKRDAALGQAIRKHVASLKKNSAVIRTTADDVIALEAKVFGKSNAAAVSTIISLPPTPLEDDIKGKEGRVLTRLHSYRERDRKLVKRAKDAFKLKHGKLYCECCGNDPKDTYGERGEDRVQAHHRTPVEELMPDSVTKAEDLAMVCPNCHDIIHAKRPWITIEQLKTILSEHIH